LVIPADGLWNPFGSTERPQAGPGTVTRIIISSFTRDVVMATAGCSFRVE
jgi:hypothetical protein